MEKESQSQRASKRETDMGGGQGGRGGQAREKRENEIEREWLFVCG